MCLCVGGGLSWTRCKQTTCELREVKAALQAQLRDVSLLLQRRTREVEQLGGLLLNENHEIRKALNHVTLATEESLTDFAVSLRTAKEALRQVALSPSLHVVISSGRS